MQRMGNITLGGNIQLTGFSDLDRGQIIVIKKVIGNYAKKFSDKGLQELSITRKEVHGENNHEVHGKLILDSGVYTSDLTEYNIFFAIDKVLKNIETQIGK